MTIDEVFDWMHFRVSENQLFDLTTWCVIWDQAFEEAFSQT